ncbi:chromatin assembly factor 1 subunit FSM-like isoform X2 [Phoenix dactylifera]|uniref:Chromatin assembly factor 1 subunit FSM-like isoform X2 n=1 Tax=Phoenix dactylifera TaxID=42345 RepID=A0A8B9AS21_PHODC|nr:chromatin assembly factor 1 subunit FSM-like isoform X2 [Phoenix dactylifera]
MGLKLMREHGFDKSPSGRFKQLQDTAINQEKGAKKPLKRKRASVEENVIGADKESLITKYRHELEELFEYYNEVSSYKLRLDDYALLSNNSVVACLLEESSLPFSKLVDEIYVKLKARGGNWEGITLASVRSTVLFIGQRVMYGIANPDADVLEDESQLCLWCWETRDMKLLPMSHHWILSIRRIGREKIHERISALSATLSALSIPESHENYKTELLKALEKLGKAINGMGIRSLVERCVREAKPNEVLIKDFDPKNEKKRVDRELQKEKCQAEKELKRLQKEAEKEQRRHEKEQAELRKQCKRQKEEAERNQRRREKEEAELRKQLALQKQATIMERFLKSKKSNDCSDNSKKMPPKKAPVSGSPCKTEDLVEMMDRVISEEASLPTVEDLRKLHVASWHKARYSNRSNRWGVRRNPKVELIKELKLRGSSIGKVPTPNKGLACNKLSGNGEPTTDTLVDKWEETIPNEISCQTDGYVAPTCVLSMIKKLLQFDKSPRPAYYGTWHRKSSVVGPRHPFKKDPDLEYDIDSDEEWEEEDPGESLSDCNEDNEEELLDEGSLNREDEDENEDSFFVPDGYLSEDEGVRVDSPSNVMEDEAKSSSSFKLEIESEEFRASLGHQKYLCTVTEQALRKNQPFVISNLMHEKVELISAVGLVGTPKFEQICLQALCMQPCPGGSIIDQSINHNSSKDQEICRPQSKSSSTPVVYAAVIPDSNLSEFVECIQSYPHGMSKLVDLLHCKFPSSTKSCLRTKVHEISDFVDNCWQVKKEVLDRLGLSNSPDESCRPKGTATLFSKWCLPPSEDSMNVPKSTQPCFKTEAHLVEDQHRIDPVIVRSSF